MFWLIGNSFLSTLSGSSRWSFTSLHVFGEFFFLALSAERPMNHERVLRFGHVDDIKLWFDNLNWLPSAPGGTF